jgi:hypothetical protein
VLSIDMKQECKHRLLEKPGKYFLGSAVNLQDIRLSLKRNVNKSKREADLAYIVDICWVSDKIRKIWEPRIIRIAKSWKEIQLLSVIDGLRPCYMDYMYNHELLYFTDKYPELSIFLNTYSRFTRNLHHEVVITRRDSKIPFGKVEMCNAPLGYPLCCYDYFYNGGRTSVLTPRMWRIALNTKGSKINDSFIDVTCSPEANVLLSGIGLTAIPHMPCSFDCKESISNGIKFMNIGRKYGFSEEMNWLKEILSSPMECSV